VRALAHAHDERNKVYPFMQQRDIITIGASGGGVEALSRLCAGLPPDLPAAVFVVLHIGSRSSTLPRILSSSGPLRARHPEDGEPILPSRIYVAPPDRHLLLEQDCIRLSHGAKENYTRPAIDPLFRSAALAHGSRVVGVVLTGHLDDGTAGLQAIKRRGGLAMVQHPDEAEAKGMPLSALAHVEIDVCAGIDALALAVSDAAGRRVDAAPGPVPEALRLEHLSSLGGGSMAENLQRIGQPSTLVCPECSGTLWELDDKRPPRYRCHTGHAYTLKALAQQQAVTVEAAMWSAVRAQQDFEGLLRKLADEGERHGDRETAEVAKLEADRALDQALRLERMLKPDGSSAQ
jgi:two-component system chemotaxis response regulator CheB